MDFRRIPFQFSSTDPAKRQAELQKRFGLPPKQDKMLIDLANPGLMGTRKECNSASSSPRLQHRVPIFVEGMAEPDKSSADATPTNVDAGQKPRVRIVPIEIENADGSTRHAFSGSPYIKSNPYQGFGIPNDMKPHRSDLPGDTKPKVEPPTSKPSSGPKVCNIPVQIEGGGQVKKSKTTSPCKKAATPKVVPVIHQNSNATKKSNSEGKVSLSPGIQNALKKIDTVLEKLKPFQSDVEKFSGTVKDKQYRYLDEMLTRLMLDLDNVETLGNENVRLARKAAIKKVQHCIDLLDTRVNDTSLNQKECNPEAEKESVSVETVPVEANDEQVSDPAIEASEVEMEETTSSAQESGTVDSQDVKSMDMDDVLPQPSQSDVVVTEVCETNENQNSTLSNSDVPGDNNQVSSGDSVTVSEVPDVEMEDPVGNSEEIIVSEVDVPESQTQSCQDQSMETCAEIVTVVASETSVSEPKDNAVDMEAGDNDCKPSALTTAELSSDLVTQNKCSMKELNEHQSLDMKLDSNLESGQHQHSNVTDTKLNESKESVAVQPTVNSETND